MPSTVPSRDKPHPAAEPNRAGCSCLTIIFYSLFLLAGLAVLGLYGFQRYVNYKTFSKMTAAEVAEFRRWSSTEIDIPPEAMIVHPAPSKSLLDEKTKLFTDANTVQKRWQPIVVASVAPRTSILDVMKSGGPLTPEQLELVSTATSTFPPLLIRGKALFSNPEYTLNPRLYPDLEPRAYYKYSYLSMCQGYALYQVYTGELNGAVETIDIMLSMTHRDPASYDIYILMSAAGAARYACVVSTVMSRTTTDTAALSNLLATLNRHRNIIFGSGDPYMFMGGNIFQRAHMQADGFSTPTSTTPASLDVGSAEELDYLEWLEKNLPPGPRKGLVQGELASRRHSFRTGGFTFLEQLRHTPFKFLANYISSMSDNAQLTDVWEYHNNLRKNWEYNRVAYDQVRLALAQRIADLNGDRIPTKPEDFIPRYLPEFPIDPTTSAPLAIPAYIPADFETSTTATPKL